jgi:hypothetical protein
MRRSSFDKLRTNGNKLTFRHKQSVRGEPACPELAEGNHERIVNALTVANAPLASILG